MASLGPLVWLDHLAEPLAVLLRVLADLLGRGAVAELDQERRQDVGAQGVVHHVALHVVERRMDAQLVLRQRPTAIAPRSRPRQAAPQPRYRWRPKRGSLPNVHPWAAFRAETSLRIVPQARRD